MQGLRYSFITRNVFVTSTMRPLEILTAALTLLCVVTALSPITGTARKRLFSAIAVTLTILSLLAQGLLEGPHWQMLPVYCAALLTTIFLLVHRLVLRKLLATLIILLTVAGCGFSALLPLFQLPNPTGQYPIGTQIIPVVNDHPRDPTSAGTDAKRALMIQVWYPSSPSGNPLAPYRIPSETTLLSSYQAIIHTHARWNAPLPEDKDVFPVLLLNPGWTGRRTYYMYLVEDLVSHGYVVVGIDHTGNSGPTHFPDGHVSQPSTTQELDFDTHTFAQLNIYGAQQLGIQVDDDRFVLDQLQRWTEDPSNRFYHRLSLQQVGALGHSFGGAVAAEDCLEDPRFKSAFDMDGSFFGPVQQQGLSKPLMMVEEDITQYTPQQLEDRANATNHEFDLSDEAVMEKSNGYQVIVHGSTHSSFTDHSLYSPWKRYSGVGAIPPLREYSIIRNYALAFFDKTLKDIDSPLLHGGDQTYPETTLRVLRGPQD